MPPMDLDGINPLFVASSGDEYCLFLEIILTGTTVGANTKYINMIPMSWQIPNKERIF